MLIPAGRAMGSRNQAELVVPIIPGACEGFQQRFHRITRSTVRHSVIQNRQGIRADTVEHTEPFGVDCRREVQRRAGNDKTIDSFS